MDKTLLPDGYGTFVVAAAIILTQIALRFGFDVPPTVWEGFIYAGLMVWMRMRTSTPPGDGVNLLGTGKE